MGTRPRIKPKYLGVKLRRIRNALGLSQTEMIARLGARGLVVPRQISAYELGKREPSLAIILRYARLAGISTDVLIDDKLKLPAGLISRLKKSR